MEKDLKEYLEKISTDVAEIRETMATKKELAEVEEKLSDKIDKVERKLSKKIKETTDYVKFLDKDISEHRRNTEAHIQPMKKA